MVMDALMVSTFLQYAIGIVVTCAPGQCCMGEEMFANELADPISFERSCTNAAVLQNGNQEHSLLQMQSNIAQHKLKLHSGIERLLLAASRKNASAPVGKATTSHLDSATPHLANAEVISNHTVVASMDGAEISTKGLGALIKALQMKEPHANATFPESAAKSNVAAVQIQKSATKNHDTSKLVKALVATSIESQLDRGASRMSLFSGVVIALIVFGLAIVLLYMHSPGFFSTKKQAAGEQMLVQGGPPVAHDSRASQMLVQGGLPSTSNSRTSLMSSHAPIGSCASLQGTGSQSVPMPRPMGPAQTSPQLSFARGSPVPTRRELPRDVMQVASSHLCPGLVVPPDNECKLVVPAIPSSAAFLDPVSLVTKDLHGNAIIQADVLATRVAKIGQRPLVVLRSCTAPRLAGEQFPQVLCSGTMGNEAGGERNVCIRNSCNELFTQIRKDPANRRYFLTNGGSRLNFEGDFIGHRVVVTDELRRIVAEATPQSHIDLGSLYFNLCIKPNTDVGLILSVLYSLEIMEAD